MCVSAMLVLIVVQRLSEFGGLKLKLHGRERIRIGCDARMGAEIPLEWEFVYP